MIVLVYDDTVGNKLALENGDIMNNLKMLQKDPLWIKSCELSRSLLFLLNASNKYNIHEGKELGRFVKSLPKDIGRAIISYRSEEQVSYFDDALVKAREVDTVLHCFLETFKLSPALKNNSKMINCIFSAFINADQLREMILNASKELEYMKLTS